MWTSKAYKLSRIDDAIKARQKEGKRLWQEINGYSANARDVLAALKEAKQAYDEAQQAMKDFADLEKKYQRFLDRADDSYRALDQNKAFGTLNQIYDINEELARYGAQQVDINKARVKEMRDAVDAWKSQQFPKIKS